MRLQLVGSYTFDEFQKAILKIFEDFEYHNVDSLRNINIYLHPCVDGRQIRLYDSGHEVDHMVYDFGRRRQIAMLSPEHSVGNSDKVEQHNTEEE